MAEEFALQQSLGEGGAVHGHEGLGCSWAIAMDGASDQFLARAGLARNQHGSVGWRDTCDALADIAHGLAFAINLGGSFQPHHCIFQQDVLAQKPRALAGAAHRGADHLGLKGFGQKVESALPHAFDGQFDGGHRGQKNHGNRRIDLVSGRKNRQPLSIRHLLISDHAVEIVGRESYAAPPERLNASQISC